MSETKHDGFTPGPWRAVTDVPMQVGGFDGKHTVVVNDTGTLLIAPTGITGTPETEANARLIAAAPDLLEACRLASSILFEELSCDCIDDADLAGIFQHRPGCFHEKIRFAIAKAEGQE